MECNRDEALRSHRIAEQKFLQHDLMGAKKFALKAQCLFPDLEGLPQLLAVLDVHIVAQQKVDGMEVNWYRILQTDASADEATIRKQYRKLALILHPDKNKSIGAEGAFKLISEAWRVLSDKDKKAAHDAKRSNTAFDYPATKPTKGFRNFTHFSGCFERRQAEGSKKSFWTGCPSCKMQYEYMRAHENKKIPCPTCGKVFRATDIEATDSRSKTQPSEESLRAARSSCFEKKSERGRRSPVHTGSSFSFHWGNHIFNAANAKHTEKADATAKMVQKIYDSVRSERIKAQREAREKSAMARMDSDREAWRRERMDRKLRRKDQQELPAKVSTHPDENGAAYETRCPIERRNAKSVSFMPTKVVENGATDARSLNSVSDQKKEFGACTGEKAARMDQMSEPFGCRIRSNFDSTSSYDSGEAFSFSKRLKVDV